MTNICIHPQYWHLRNDIENIVAGDYVAIKVFCHNRNVVEKVMMQGMPFVVKRYKRPNAVNRFIYTNFRKSKARRAYEYASLLLNEGIETPFPVAYIEEKHWGMFTTCYFISEYMPHGLMKEAMQELTAEKALCLTRDFLEFTAGMHAKGILPGDFNASNIFYYQDSNSGKFRFALTDINRMRFGKIPSTSEAMHSFEQLGVPLKGLYSLADKYCSQKEADLEYTLFLFLLHRMLKRMKSSFKRKIKGMRAALSL